MQEEHAIHLGMALVVAPLVALDGSDSGSLGVRAMFAVLLLVAGTTSIVGRWLAPPHRHLPRARIADSRYSR